MERLRNVRKMEAGLQVNDSVLHDAICSVSKCILYLLRLSLATVVQRCLSLLQSLLYRTCWNGKRGGAERAEVRIVRAQDCGKELRERRWLG